MRCGRCESGKGERRLCCWRCCMRTEWSGVGGCWRCVGGASGSERTYLYDNSFSGSSIPAKLRNLAKGSVRIAIFCVDLVVGLVTSLMRHCVCGSAHCRFLNAKSLTGTMPTELGTLADLTLL